MSEPTPRTDAWQDADWAACGNDNDYKRMLLAYGHCRQLEYELLVQTLSGQQLGRLVSEKDADRIYFRDAIAAQRTALLALFDEAERTGSQGIAVRGREILGPER